MRTCGINLFPHIEKIDEIEKGIVPEIIDVIKNPFEIKSIYFDVLNSSFTEIMLILTTSTVFMSEKNDGIIPYLIDAANRNIKIRIITPSFSNVENEIDNLSQKDNIEVRRIESPFDARLNILVVDEKYSLIVELKNDTSGILPKQLAQQYILQVNQMLYHLLPFLKHYGNKPNYMKN